ncbi:MAG: DUF5667 domain-containing protein [Dehalococcoidales bacterium]|nr:DUF5667 domain-containing protein [Dehalococcoidales bacterium]
MKKRAEILVRCIEEIRAGRATLPECLKRYPDARAELEPLLRVALSIKADPDIKPAESFKLQARASLMEHIRVGQSAKSATAASSQPGIGYRMFTGRVRAAAITAAVVVAVAAVFTGAAYASQSSLPGETLYSVKLGKEQVQRVLTLDAVAEVELELSFAGVRLDELEELVSMPVEQAAITGGTGKIYALSVAGSLSGRWAAVSATQAERISQAVAGYQKNLNLAISKSERLKDNEALLETVALVILDHLDRIDGIEDKTPGANHMAVISSREIAINGHMHAVQNLAALNPSRASQINQQAVQGRLARAEAQAARGNGKGAQDALQDSEKMRRFGNGMPDRSGGEESGQEADQGSGTSSPSEQEGSSGSDSNNGKTSPNSDENTKPSEGGQDTGNQQRSGQGGQSSEAPKPGAAAGGATAVTQQPGSTRGGSGDNLRQL